MVLCASSCRPDRPTDQLVVATDTPVRSLDPRLATDNASAKVSRLVFEGLTEVDEQGAPRLVLAAAITPTDVDRETGEPLAYAVTIRDDAVFHDGTPLTGRDVAYTYQSVMDPAFGAIIRGAFRRRFSSVQVDPRDPQVVHFRLRRPLATFLTDIVLGIAPAWLKDRPKQRFDGLMIGSGPWRIAKTSRKDRVVLRRVEGHRGFRGEGSGPRELVFAAVLDEGARALSVLGGGAELAMGGLSPAVLDSAASTGRATVKAGPGIAWAYLGLNLRHRHLADRRVRKAIALALDRQGIIDGLLGGRARRAEGMMAPEHWAYVPLPPTPHDPEKARRLLDAAELREGRQKPGDPRFSLELKVSTNRLRRSIGQAVKRDLGKVGIDVVVRSFEIGTFLADVRAGRFDAFMLLLPEPLEPDFLAWMFHSQNAPDKRPDPASRSPWAKLDRRGLLPGLFSAEVEADEDCGPWSRRATRAGLEAFALAPLGLAESFGSANRTGYHQPIVSCLLELGRSTSDRAERKRLYGRAQRIIAADVPVVPLWWEDQTALVRQGVTLPELAMDGRFSGLYRARF